MFPFVLDENQKPSVNISKPTIKYGFLITNKNNRVVGKIKTLVIMCDSK
jgi:hypothetical protein